MHRIERLLAREILDSRGRPTVWARCELAGGAAGAASVPSGASTGGAEAVELRDGEPQRYRGLGCRRAVAAIRQEIQSALAGRSFAAQAELDHALCGLDGTPDKNRLGGNAVLAVSLAYARACAAAAGVPLYAHFGRLLGRPPAALPRLTINLFSGGKHAGKQVAIQDVLVVPRAATIDESLAMTYEVYQCAAELVRERYGMRLLVADEGGLAPPFENAEAMLLAAVEAIRRAGLRPGDDVALAVDVASSHFFSAGAYALDGESLDGPAMVRRLLDWVERYPIVSVEDGLAEEDWPHWPALASAAAPRALVVGDDLLCTNPERIRHAIAARACNTLLLKVNQVGTLTEAAHACRLARAAGWMVTISVRSGETEDDWAADLAVGWSGDQFKNGSITRSERLAKYNRLLAIEAETGWPVVAWPRAEAVP
jgi:enolase